MFGLLEGTYRVSISDDADFDIVYEGSSSSYIEFIHQCSGCWKGLTAYLFQTMQTSTLFTKAAAVHTSSSYINVRAAGRDLPRIYFRRCRLRHCLRRQQQFIHRVHTSMFGLLEGTYRVSISDDADFDIVYE